MRHVKNWIFFLILYCCQQKDKFSKFILIRFISHAESSSKWGGWIEWYLRINELEQIMSVTIKPKDGTRSDDADNSNSQWRPVNPKRHEHSYFRGGGWSRHLPPFWHGWYAHSSSLTQSLPDNLNPVGHLCWGAKYQCSVGWMWHKFLFKQNHKLTFTQKEAWHEIKRKKEMEIT